MYSFKEFVVRKDEVNFNPADLSSSLRTNTTFSLPTAALKGVGKAVGVVPAALSGAVPAIAGTVSALRGSKSRAYRAACTILEYLHQNERFIEPVLRKLGQAIERIEAGSGMGVVGGGGLPSVDTARGYSTMGSIASSVWKGLMTSAHNLVDTLFGSSHNDASDFLGFREAFTHFFEALGQMNKDQAFPLLKNLEFVLSKGGGCYELDTDLWR